MSHIDSYRHRLLGHLAYLPVYEPLEDFSEGADWGDADFGAAPGNLILGGGSGEHPGLVVHKLDKLAAYYLDDTLDAKQKQMLNSEQQAFIESHCIIYPFRVLEFCEWGIRDYVDLNTAAHSNTSVSSALQDDEHYYPVEDWLMRSLGEFILLHRPELLQNQQQFNGITAHLSLKPSLENVTLAD